MDPNTFLLLFKYYIKYHRKSSDAEFMRVHKILLEVLKGTSPKCYYKDYPSYSERLEELSNVPEDKLHPRLNTVADIHSSYWAKFRGSSVLHFIALIGTEYIKQGSTTGKRLPDRKHTTIITLCGREIDKPKVYNSRVTKECKICRRIYMKSE